jgi:HK97 family phage prohead protease
MPKHGCKLLSVADWRAAVKAGATDLGVTGIRKTYDALIEKAPDQELALDFAISTQAVDRDQDTVAVAGWDVANFLKNPVVLWAHNYDSFPVARALSVTQTANALKSRALFMSKELQATHPSAFGYTVYQLYVEQFLNAVSVGFIPKKYVMVNDAEAGRQWGYDMLEQELLEYSCVPVPSNPEALVEARGKGIDVTPVREWAERFLQGEQGEGFWAPRDLVERTFYVISGKGASVLVNRGAKPAKDAGDEPAHDPAQIMQDMQAAHDTMKSAHAAQSAGHTAMGDHLAALGKATPGSDEYKTLHGVAMKCMKAFASDRAAAEAAHGEIAGHLAKLFPPKADDTPADKPAADDPPADGDDDAKKAAKASAAKFDGAAIRSVHDTMKSVHEAQAASHGALGDCMKAMSKLAADDSDEDTTAGYMAPCVCAGHALKAIGGAHAVMDGLHKVFGHAMKGLALSPAVQGDASGKTVVVTAAGLLASAIALGKSGARHSAADMKLLHDAHKAIRDLGSDCKTLEPDATEEDAIDLDLTVEAEIDADDEIALKDFELHDDAEIDIEDPAVPKVAPEAIAAALKAAGLDPDDVTQLVKDTLAEVLAGAGQ